MKDAEFVKNMEKEVNRIWTQCCIKFKISISDDAEVGDDVFQDGALVAATESGKDVKITEEAKKIFQTKNDAKCIDLYFVKDVKAKKSGQAKLVDYKGYGFEDTVIGGGAAAIDDEGVESATLWAHEIGHILCLGHEAQVGERDASDLMHPIAKGELMRPGLTIELTPGKPIMKKSDCDIARKCAEELAKGQQ